MLFIKNKEDYISNSYTLKLAMEALGIISLLLITSLMMRFIEKVPFKEIGFKKGNIINDLTFGAIFSILMLFVTISILLLGGWFNWNPYGSFKIKEFLIIAAALFINAITQELLFRGYIFFIIKNYSSMAAILITSTLFSLAHIVKAAENLLAFLNLFLIGVLYAYARNKSKNLWIIISMPFFWNFLLSDVLGLTTSGYDLSSGLYLLKENKSNPIFTGSDFGIEASIVNTVSIAIGFVLFNFIYKFTNKKHKL